MNRLFVFDMDGTLLPHTTAMIEIAKITGHTEELVSLEKQLLSKEIGNAQFARGIYDLWESLDAQTVKSSFLNSPKLANINETIKKVASSGGISCIITSAPHFFAHHFYEFGFDYILASKPFELHEREFTPEHIIHGKDKPQIAHQLCHQLQLKFEETVAFGDSLSDVPLFQKLSHTVSVNGDLHINEHSKYHYKGMDLLEAFDLVFQ